MAWRQAGSIRDLTLHHRDERSLFHFTKTTKIGIFGLCSEGMSRSTEQDLKLQSRSVDGLARNGILPQRGVYQNPMFCLKSSATSDFWYQDPVSTYMKSIKMLIAGCPPPSIGH